MNAGAAEEVPAGAAAREFASESDLAAAARDDAPHSEPPMLPPRRGGLRRAILAGAASVAVLLGTATLLVLHFGSREANTLMIGSTSSTATPSEATVGARLVAPGLNPIIQPEQTTKLVAHSSSRQPRCARRSTGFERDRAARTGLQYGGDVEPRQLGGSRGCAGFGRSRA